MEEKRKMGRPRKIESPEVLLDWFLKYKEWTKENPILKNDFRGGAAKEVWLELERPLTTSGFESFIARESNYEILGIDQYLYEEEQFPEFMGIANIIRREIRQDQVAGAMAGIYNANLTARINGLTEKTETTGKTQHTIINLGNGEKPEEDS